MSFQNPDTLKSKSINIFFGQVSTPKKIHIWGVNNYPKFFILSKNWDGFFKFGHLKNEIISEKKIEFFGKFSTPKIFFEKKFTNKYPKTFILSKKLRWFSKSRRLKMTSNLRIKLNFSQSTPPRKIFSKKNNNK